MTRPFARYIEDNPRRWQSDRNNPRNVRRLPPPVDVNIYLAALETYE